MEIIGGPFKPLRPRIETLERDARRSLGVMLKLIGTTPEEATAVDWQAASHMLEAALTFQEADTKDERIVALGDLVERAIERWTDVQRALYQQRKGSIKRSI